MRRHYQTWTAYALRHGYSPSTSPKPSPLRAPHRGISGTDSADLSVLPFSSPLDLRVVEQEDYIASEYQPVPAVFRAAVREELSEDRDELLESDPFRKEAIPLYQVITNYLKENDVTFVNI